jgi:isoquinoline 1-oxidoreductase
MKPLDLTRRDFFATGTGLFVFIRAAAQQIQQPEAARPPGRGAYPTDFNAYLRISADGRVACFVGKVELGQGAMTSLAQCLAEELDVPYDSVDMVMGDTDLCPYDMGTFGSMCTPIFSPVLRAAGAEARAVLLQMAAERLGAPVDRLQVKAGVITDPVQSRRVTYGELVEGRRIERHIDKVPVKAVSAFTVIRQSPARRKDGLDKVTGKAKYSGDFVLPGMLCARILMPPAHGATLKSADTSAAEKTGARVVKDNGTIAVLHERREVADRALGLIQAQWDRPRTGLDDKTIFDHLQKTGPKLQPAGESGNLAEGEKLAAHLVERTYLNSYVAHAAMETHSALAQIEGGKVTVWASTQAPFSVRGSVAQALGVEPRNVRIVTPYVGGGFGGKSAAEQGVEAARLAQITGRPVQVIRDRAEEFFYDTFRPAAVVKIRSGLSGAGKIVLWDYQVWGAGNGGARTSYDIPHQRTAFSGGWQGGNPPDMHPFGIGPWRAPSANSNTFAIESHMDILAAQAGKDPLEFRLNHLGEARLRRVLETAAKQFGWKPGKAPTGRGVGMAIGIYSNTHVATFAEVSVDKTTGRVRVKRVVSALDQGVTLNPEGMRQQMEGCITMGLGYTLAEEIRFKDGEVLDRNFDTYEIPRFSWLPKIETILVDNPGTPAGAGGEPPIVTMGASISNAIYDAVGARVLQLPITPERVKAALAKG